MALWDKPESGAAAAAPASGAATSPNLHAQESHSARKERTDMKESIIAAGLLIEGKINGNGHVRVVLSSRTC